MEEKKRRAGIRKALRKAKEWHKDGLLDDGDFEVMKARLTEDLIKIGG